MHATDAAPTCRSTALSPRSCLPTHISGWCRRCVPDAKPVGEWPYPAPPVGEAAIPRPAPQPPQTGTHPAPPPLLLHCQELRKPPHCPAWLLPPPPCAERSRRRDFAAEHPDAGSLVEQLYWLAAVPSTPTVEYRPLQVRGVDLAVRRPTGPIHPHESCPTPRGLNPPSCCGLLPRDLGPPPCCVIAPPRALLGLLPPHPSSLALAPCCRWTLT